MKIVKTLLGSAILTLSATAIQANAAAVDNSGDYTMGCDDITLTLAVGLAYGDIAITDASILLTDSEGASVTLSNTFECGALSLSLEDKAAMQAQAETECNALVTPMSDEDQAALCANAAEDAVDYLADSIEPAVSDYLEPYILTNLSTEVDCALHFFSWCLAYGNNATYDFEDGSTDSHFTYISTAGGWIEDFSLDSILQTPVGCSNISLALLSGDANEDGTVTTDMDLLDASLCAIANPSTLEVISFAYGFAINIAQSGAE